ncbi:MAG: helix-turn-helix domain-containing protein [Rubrobacteraceae bacterium]|nr:helix-turn-helix domain-containing protein [Rubrobacteraceae bacterium]
MQESVTTRDGKRCAAPDLNDNPLFSTGELARYLGCSTTFARKLMDEGEIPSMKLSGIRRVRRSDVNELVERRLQASSRGREDV